MFNSSSFHLKDILGGEKVSLTKEQILDVLEAHLTRESLLLLSTIQFQKAAIAKEELWRLANEKYRSRQNDPNQKDFIASRYTMDIHTARLEGAGLVTLKTYGRIRTYTISPLGTEFWNYINTKQKQ